MLNFKDYVADWPDVAYQNYVEWLRGLASKWGDKTAILHRTDGNGDFTRWSYNRLEEECHKIARSLLAAGLVRGDRVVLWAENRPEWMAVWLGTAIAGLIIVPV